MHLIAWSIPVFVAFIVLEYWLARRARRDVYRLSVSVSDVGCGVVQQLFGVLTSAAFVAIYFLVYEFRLFDLDPRAATTWLVAMIGVDFVYYWWHRASHEVGLLWATHVVHHHSEDYNLAVALRQGIFTAGVLIVFGLPLALFGVPPLVFGVSKAINALYQFWIHTELIGDLGPAEAVLNTPRHHRVHHAVNPRYLDKNYGGISIVWDRLFGTFARLDEAPVYGTTRRLGSLNPLWAQFEHFAELARRARAERGLGRKLRVLLAHPGWTPRGPAAPLTEAELAARAAGRFHVPVSSAMALYVLLQAVGIVAAAMAVLIAAGSWPTWLAALACAAVIAGAVALAGLVERRRWAVPLEVGRLATTVVVAGLVLARG
ncbi:Sterol desaturase/sphingolipid hydroxylase, fatty acid hydroxylase superfamily [Nannocystis exedens]|uniref:Sterol desaturase/sphingolipid hydroxylase, fatty acid hydroxylase superfamily n=1 Tax=Nannocystis exedens TaxID=54 RepID=A0A1I1U403_9BACT|nr:sterol desaturase family protein [Nannocystis exedens]PCC71414.1 sterol desaturase [Nannocystis exedens]SFD65527.1 Sterol desaturase/sphingolipid hydroxylase, fatty acid hydroxylase superfamily [Nannocystis exedens]